MDVKDKPTEIVYDKSVPLYPHLLSPQFKQVMQPSINTMALVLQLLGWLFLGNAWPSVSPCRVGLRIRDIPGTQIMPPANLLKVNATLPRNEYQP